MRVGIDPSGKELRIGFGINPDLYNAGQLGAVLSNIDGVERMVTMIGSETAADVLTIEPPLPRGLVAMGVSSVLHVLASESRDPEHGGYVTDKHLRHGATEVSRLVLQHSGGHIDLHMQQQEGWR